MESTRDALPVPGGTSWRCNSPDSTCAPDVAAINLYLEQGGAEL